MCGEKGVGKFSWLLGMLVVLIRDYVEMDLCWEIEVLVSDCLVFLRLDVFVFSDWLVLVFDNILFFDVLLFMEWEGSFVWDLLFNWCGLILLLFEVREVDS